jgi:hypothetical protein
VNLAARPSLFQVNWYQFESSVSPKASGLSVSTAQKLTQSLPLARNDQENCHYRSFKMELQPPNATSPAQSSSVQSPPPTTHEAQLMAVAQSLEAAFLSEMLKSAGIGETPSDFGGGAGEDQFASFLRDEQAKQMTAAGGIGLAQSMFDAMMARSR